MAETHPYSVHPSVLTVKHWIATLKEKSGRSLDEWLTLINHSGPPTEKERRVWLKEQYQLGTNTAGWLAERAAGRANDEDAELYLKQARQHVEDMFSGGKAPLRPIYDALLKLSLGLGKDVKACPCKTMVPLYRNHVIAQIKPATRTRIDLGFALNSRPAEGRLIDTGGFAKKDRITHRIPITTINEIDSEVQQWLRIAYQEDK